MLGLILDWKGFVVYGSRKIWPIVLNKNHKNAVVMQVNLWWVMSSTTLMSG